MKVCTVCKQDKPQESFHRSKISKDGFGYRCMPCDKLARAGYRERNRARFAKVNRRKTLKWKYGISIEEYETILRGQLGRCEICKEKQKGMFSYGAIRVVSLSIDHCHVSNRVRGLLCNRCNRCIGLMQENPELLKKMAMYLETH